MSICGYDEKMGVGISHFSEGLVAAIGTKARSHGVPFATQVAHEEDQMEVLLAHLRSQSGTVAGRAADILTAFTGIVLLARGLLAFNDLSNRSPEERVESTTQDLIRFLQEFESAYEALPEGSSHSSRTKSAWAAALPLVDESSASDRATGYSAKIA